MTPRQVRSFLISFFLVSLGACLTFSLGAAGGKTEPKAKEVVIEKRQYAPAILKIQVGDHVVWINKDKEEHTATGDKDEFDTGDIPSGKRSKAIQFTKPGKYGYYCDPHPKMKGTIIVEEKKPK